MSETVHDLKVVPPYFGALLDGSKTFEVRRNDRAFQAGDVVNLREWVPGRCYTRSCTAYDNCPAYTGNMISRRVSFVYSGDPRIGGIEPGFVVLALSEATS